jgi:hypothetical protein
MSSSSGKRNSPLTASPSGFVGVESLLMTAPISTGKRRFTKPIREKTAKRKNPSRRALLLHDNLEVRAKF